MTIHLIFTALKELAVCLCIIMWGMLGVFRIYDWIHLHRKKRSKVTLNHKEDI